MVPVNEDRRVITLEVGKPFTPDKPGKFVPLAQWLDMQDVYIRDSFKKK